MAYRLAPQVAGELGDGTVLDPRRHPPVVRGVEYMLDSPDVDDVIESFPVFLVSALLAVELEAKQLGGFALEHATVRPSDEYVARYGCAAHTDFRWLRLGHASLRSDAWLDGEHHLCVSDAMMEVLRDFRLEHCNIQRLPN